jgi:DNA-binding Lrp family transcriptional regulator
MNTNEKDSDLAIIKHVVNHPKATRVDVAGATGASESTVQRKLATWEKSGDLINQYILGPQNSIFAMRVLIGVKLYTDNIESEEFNYHNQGEMICFIKWGLSQQVKFAGIMSGVILEHAELAFGGPYEIILLVSTLDRNILADFVTSVIQKLPGVTETTTTTLVSYAKSVWQPKTQT